MAKVSKEDSELFRAAVKQLKFSAPRAKLSKKIITVDLYDKPDETISPTDILFYSRGGLQHKTLKNLKTGKIPTSSELDLHGLTVHEARENLSDFIKNALQKNVRCVRIIHGKGNILKNHVVQWLKQINEVLAFASAVPRQGGTGAVSVILKRS
jgi:DNA-nicking Smr family endonuclease